MLNSPPQTVVVLIVLFSFLAKIMKTCMNNSGKSKKRSTPSEKE